MYVFVFVNSICLWFWVGICWKDGCWSLPPLVATIVSYNIRELGCCIQSVCVCVSICGSELVFVWTKLCWSLPMPLLVTTIVSYNARECCIQSIWICISADICIWFQVSICVGNRCQKISFVTVSVGQADLVAMIVSYNVRELVCCIQSICICICIFVCICFSICLWFKFGICVNTVVLVTATIVSYTIRELVCCIQSIIGMLDAKRAMCARLFYKSMSSHAVSGFLPVLYLYLCCVCAYICIRDCICIFNNF